MEGERGRAAPAAPNDGERGISASIPGLEREVEERGATARFPVYLDTADNDELSDDSEVAITAVIRAL